MQFRVKSNGHEISETELRHRFPKKSLPAVIDASTTELLGVELIHETEPPKTKIGQTATRGPAVLNDDGVWMRTWLIHTASDEQIKDEVQQIQNDIFQNLNEERKRRLTDGFIEVKIDTQTNEDLSKAWTVDSYSVKFPTTLLDRSRYEALLYSARNAMYDGKHLEDFLDSTAGLEFYMSCEMQSIALKLKTVFQIVDALSIHDSLIDRQYLKHRKAVLDSEDPRDYDFYQNW